FPRVPCRDLIPAWGRNVRFGWRRFWSPRGESIVLTAGGFLLDPHVRKTTAVGVDVPLQLSFQDIEPAARFAQPDGQRVLEEPAQKVSHGCWCDTPAVQDAPSVLDRNAFGGGRGARASTLPLATQLGGDLHRRRCRREQFPDGGKRLRRCQISAMRSVQLPLNELHPGLATPCCLR